MSNKKEPEVRRRRKKKTDPNIRPKHIFILLVAICVLLIILSAGSQTANGILRGGFNVVLMPLQKGFNAVGGGVYGQAENLMKLHSLESRNASLESQVAELTEQNTRYQQQVQELAQLQKLVNMKEQYPDYQTIGAHIIGKNSDNWYRTILVDRGSDDGIKVNMNVIADGGLVGIVTSVSRTTSTISTIINDNRNVGAMALKSQDPCIVTGDISLYEKGRLQLSRIDKDDDIEDDDKIVTANTSDLYLPGILIGYAADLKVDANNLTKSGQLIPVVDFSHLDSVLIITTLKDTGAQN